MEVTDLLDPSGVIPNLRVTGKRQALQELARRAATLTGEDEHKIFESLREREQLGSTGIGNGTAVPHGRIPGFKRALTMFARLEKPIDFDSMDGEPVDLLIALFAPPEAGSEHLRALARVSRMLRQDDMRQQLRAAQSADAIMALLVREAAPSAAA